MDVQYFGHHPQPHPLQFPIADALPHIDYAAALQANFEHDHKNHSGPAPIQFHQHVFDLQQNDFQAEEQRRFQLHQQQEQQRRLEEQQLEQQQLVWQLEQQRRLDKQWQAHHRHQLFMQQQQERQRLQQLHLQEEEQQAQQQRELEQQQHLSQALVELKGEIVHSLSPVAKCH
ncbi:hypothetical protein BKA82DRAFT_4020320 [Pisolithus tinctorius]|nr:hypothetical protein BKA82DRAFT_4020320 [Pisolithus tinctorius]